MVYNKAQINDQLVSFDHLTSASRFNPFKKLWFTRPQYASFSDMKEKPSGMHYIVRVVGGLIMMSLGYRLGTYESDLENKIIKESKVVQFESEEQIFDLLFNQEKDAVFLHFYNPGHTIDQNFNRTVEQASSNPRYKDIVFMTVHCRKNLSFCLSKAFPNRI